jgi:hypothetical protein
VFTFIISIWDARVGASAALDLLHVEEEGPVEAHVEVGEGPAVAQLFRSDIGANTDRDFDRMCLASRNDLFQTLDAMNF